MAAETEKIMQCQTQNLFNACLAGSTASSASRAARSFGFKWLTGPITTVRDGHSFPKAVAVTRVSSSAWVWFSECSRCYEVVHGNYPNSVVLTVFLRLCGVRRITARQTNARSNRHPPDANRPTLEERRGG